MYFIITIGLTILFTAVFFGIPYAISAKFGNNYYAVSIAILCLMFAFFIAAMMSFFNDPRSYGYIPEDEVTVYDAVNNVDYSYLDYFGH